MVFCFDESLSVIRAGNHRIPLVLVGQQRDPWFRANDVAAFLGYTQPKVAISKHIKAGKHKKKLQELLPNVVSTSSPSYDLRSRWLSWIGVRIIVTKSRTEPAMQVAKQLGIEIIPKHSFHEADTISAIQRAFSGEITWRQHRPANTCYRVDLYLPDYNIVVECDERGHASYGREEEHRRTHAITVALNSPKWVRFDPDVEHFDMFAVIGQIYQHVRASLVKK